MGNNSKPDENRDPQVEFLRPLENKESRWGFRGKTVWDWMQLFIVLPLALVGTGLLFSMLQADRQQKIEERRAKSELALQEKRAQDDALQAYLDQMNSLMLNKNLLGTG